MEDKVEKNIDFLSGNFTSNEFDFITNIKSGDTTYDDLIKTQFNYKDIVVSLINKFDESKFQEGNENENHSIILQNTQEILNLINENIKNLQFLQSSSQKITNDILNLLVTVESNPNTSEQYSSQIQLIKSELSDFAEDDNEKKEILSQNNNKIISFLNDENTKKYISEFNITSTTENTNTHTQEIKNINENIPENTSHAKINDTLIVSEKDKKVYLPYKESEIVQYLKQFPNDYLSFDDVVDKEYILPLDYYMKHPVLARFRELYALIKDREGKSIIDAFRYAINAMFNYSLNPVIVAACKTQQQLEDYMVCLEKNKLDEFTHFKIKFEVNPLA